MAGKFERKLMRDIDLDDPFFDSLKTIQEVQTAQVL